MKILELVMMTSMVFDTLNYNVTTSECGSDDGSEYTHPKHDDAYGEEEIDYNTYGERCDNLKRMVLIHI